MTRAAPNLSAIAPANGWPIPHTRFCSAIANANVSRVHARSKVIGGRNRPKLWRVPSESISPRHPQAMITAGVRQPELPVFPESMMRSSARHRQSPLAGIKLLSHDLLGALDELAHWFGRGECAFNAQSENSPTF